MVGVSDDRDLARTPNSVDLLDILIKRQECNVRCPKHLKRGDKTSLYTHLETEVGCHTHRYGIEYGSSKFTDCSMK
ncbi:hypothetical protein D3C73_1581940 [compost metagenome]